MKRRFSNFLKINSQLSLGTHRGYSTAALQQQIKSVVYNFYKTYFNLKKPIGYVRHQHVCPFRPHFTCFVSISEQTATSAPYNINCLVFITEMKSVYCAVRTGSLDKAVCASSLKG